MSRHSWIKAALGVAATLLIVSVLLPWNDGKQKQPQSPQTLSDRPTDRQGTEMEMKQTLLSEDINATKKLLRQDAQGHLHAMVAALSSSNDGGITAYGEQMKKSHGQLHALIWVDRHNGRSRQIAGSALDRDAAGKAQSVRLGIQAAKEAVKHGRSYESPSLQAGKDRYFILAEPSADGKHAVIGLFNEHILRAVEEHQRRNLRMIPYPREGRFRVESVYPNTMRDITVKTGHDNENASHFYENEIVVRFRNKPEKEQLLQIRRDLGSKEEGRMLGDTYIFHSESMSFRELKQYFVKRWNPLYTEPHYMYMTNDNTAKDTKDVSMPNDILFSQYQWNLPAVEVNRGWNLSRGNKNVTVAVIDTGADLEHPDLKGQFVKGYNLIDPAKAPYDDVGHGTHVAGIISALVNNNEGVAGMTWYNKVMPVKVLDQSGSGTTYSVAQGIIWAADHGAKVINLSLGNYVDSQFLHEAIKYAYNKDVVLISAAGNDNTERPGYPAAYPEVLAVAATDSSMKRATYSNYGDYVDVSAPGTNIASTYPGSQYAALSGTSMASPHVSAVAALIRSQNPELQNTEVMDILRNNVVDLGEAGHDKYFGYGQIDAYKALSAAQGEGAPLQLWPQHLRSRFESILHRFNP
ncbi:S8 family peptidase [Paenibacillus sp. P96]|uniref:S8 family peptidase n=1 Tax=Paenibacillus zeirhizosphaerae TaxID=2987519 RepID=A0ABT9FQE7_9BACL|nr:S8 family peptidase [Paenibacillus sp. P96]MDP4096968.1 S8 family peptidase [Paenibacillus sp. P96]